MAKRADYLDRLRIGAQVISLKTGHWNADDETRRHSGRR